MTLAYMDADSIPLPESSTSLSTTSLDQISRAADRDLHAQTTSIYFSHLPLEQEPPLVPLPQSEQSSCASSLRALEAIPSQLPRATRPEEQYRYKIRQLVQHLPYLGAVAAEPKDCRDVRTRDVVCYDWVNGSTEPRPVSIINHRVLRSAPQDTRFRIVVLEDLDPPKIDFVGSAFDIPPSFFSAHLQGSGYGGLEEKEAPDLTNSWSKFRARRSQFSLTWLRPVLPSLPITTKLRNGLISATEVWPKTHCIFPRCSVGSHTVKTSPNIFRQSDNFSAKLGGDISGDFPIGWEERITVWKGNSNGCNTMVVCLDPCLTMRYWGNVFIPSSEQTPAQNVQAASANEGLGLVRRNTVAVRNKDGKWYRRALHSSFAPFRSISTRGVSDVDGDEFLSVEQAKTFADKLQLPKSSLDAIQEWLAQDPRMGEHPEEMLLRILHDDIIVLVDIMRESLESIGRQIIDMPPAQLQGHALHWRSLLSRFQYELQQLLAQTPPFLDFIYGDRGDEDVPLSSRRLAENILRLARETSEQVERAYGSLRAELSIADARRSIQEAESIAKLTELAFLFIPLTFAASLFSMQIKELQTAPPVTYFVGTAIALISFSYIMRLVVRSSMLGQYKAHVFVNIRKHAEISESESITTRQFLNWATGGIFPSWSFFPYIIFLLIAGVLALPLIFLWRRGFDTGYSTVITLVVIPMDLAILWMLISGISSTTRGNWKTTITSKIRRRSAESSDTSTSSLAGV